MAVFTEVSEGEAGELVRALQLGEMRELRGIHGGIENTNYFLTTERGEFVLTLFERLTAEQLPFYLHLMKHLAQHGIPVPEPQALPGSASADNPDGRLLHTLCGKPAAMVDKLRGHSELAPTPAHCAAVGEMLARMHLAARDYPRSQPNLRGLPWWNETVPVVLPHVDEAQRALLRSELAFQNHIAQGSAYAALPRGAIHADLFRDNVMFEDGRLTGFFDFYFAGVDTWLFDLAVCLNDWCVDLPTGAHDEVRAAAFLRAYAGVRPLAAAERRLLPAMLRAGALRFWISRLWDFHLPREASMLKPHDPGHFERVLRHRVQQAAGL
ncbi:MAG: homoserine kinase [Ramlibacter sp.]|nr:homoserine kinase [Ramlibacter sp.]